MNTVKNYLGPKGFRQNNSNKRRVRRVNTEVTEEQVETITTPEDNEITITTDPEGVAEVKVETPEGEVFAVDDIEEGTTDAQLIDEVDALVNSRRRQNSKVRKFRNSREESKIKKVKNCDTVVTEESETDVTPTVTEVEETEVATENSRKTFKVARKVTKNGKVVRKVASVEAPSLEEAIDAVKTNDVENEIEADGYEELVEELPQDPEVTTDVKEGEVIPEAQRDQNSFTGVSSFVERKYGIKLS